MAETKGGVDVDCPICGAELAHWDQFGRLATHQDGKVFGDIWKCPNGANQDGTYESELFSVAGSFYSLVDTGELHEGFPV